MPRRQSAHKFAFESGKRKTARATAVIKAGVGQVRVNGFPIELLQPEVARSVMVAPLILAEGLRDHVDIDIKVHGGGFMGQAEAVAMAISRAMVRWFREFKPDPSIDIEKRLLAYDRTLLAGDSRQKESKKFGRSGARRRPQKSYR